MSTKRRSKKNTGTESSATQWLVGAGVLAAIVLAAWLWNKKSYPEVSSPDGLLLIRALYTACSSQSEERLAKVEQKLLAVDTQGRLNEAEREAFKAIIDDARTGDWHAASTASYQFAQDQVR